LSHADRLAVSCPRLVTSLSIHLARSRHAGLFVDFKSFVCVLLVRIEASWRRRRLRHDPLKRISQSSLCRHRPPTTFKVPTC